MIGSRALLADVDGSTGTSLTLQTFANQDDCCCRVTDCCDGQYFLINLVQFNLSALCITSLVRRWVLARARMEGGSKKENKFSTSSGVVQKNVSASILDMVLKYPVPLHNAKHLLNIVLLYVLYYYLN